MKVLLVLAVPTKMKCLEFIFVLKSQNWKCFFRTISYLSKFILNNESRDTAFKLYIELG